MVQKLTLSQACEGMIRYKTAIGRSRHTIADYRVSFKKLLVGCKNLIQNVFGEPIVVCPLSLSNKGLVEHHVIGHFRGIKRGF
ncbi:MAG: hypothetical protein KAH97_10205 [Anaerolineales bacterium]|nr:hypothetical protein [Anaerolineales bacterium]